MNQIGVCYISGEKIIHVIISRSGNIVSNLNFEENCFNELLDYDFQETDEVAVSLPERMCKLLFSKISDRIKSYIRVGEEYQDIKNFTTGILREDFFKSDSSIEDTVDDEVSAGDTARDISGNDVINIFGITHVEERVSADNTTRNTSGNDVMSIVSTSNNEDEVNAVGVAVNINDKNSVDDSIDDFTIRSSSGFSEHLSLEFSIKNFFKKIESSNIESDCFSTLLSLISEFCSQPDPMCLKELLRCLIRFYNKFNIDSFKVEGVCVFNELYSLLEKESYMETLKTLDSADISVLFCIFSDLGVLKDLVEKRGNLISEMAKAISPSSLGFNKVQLLLCAIAEVHSDINYCSSTQNIERSLKELIEKVKDEISVNHESFSDDNIELLLSFSGRKEDYSAQQVKDAIQNIRKKASRKSSDRREMVEPQGRRTSSRLSDVEVQSSEVEVEVVGGAANERTDPSISSVDVEDVTASPRGSIVRGKGTSKGKKKEILDKIIRDYNLSEGYFLKDKDDESELCKLLENIQEVNYRSLELRDFMKLEGYEKVFELINEEMYKVVLRIFLSVGFWVRNPSKILDFLFEKLNDEMKEKLIEGDKYYSLAFAFGCFHKDNDGSNDEFPRYLLLKAKSILRWESIKVNSVIVKVSETLCDSFCEFFIDNEVGSKEFIKRLLVFLEVHEDKEKDKRSIEKNINDVFGEPTSWLPEQSGSIKISGRRSHTQKDLSKLLSRFNKSDYSTLSLNQISIVRSDYRPLLFAVNIAGIDQGVRCLQTFSSNLSVREEYETILKRVLERIRAQKLYKGLAWNATAAFTSFLDASSNNQIKVISSLLNKTSEGVEPREEVDHSFNVENTPTIIPIVQSLQEQQQLDQGSLTPSTIYDQLCQVTFDCSDEDNPLTWASIDFVNPFMNSATMNNSYPLAYYISPISYGFNTSQAVQDAAKHICKREIEGYYVINDHYSNEVEKPFVFIANTQTVLNDGPSRTDKREGGSHWVSWVLLPKKYKTLSGKEVNNGKYQVFLFDPLGQESFPEKLNTFLTQGTSIIENTDTGKKCVKLLSFCTKEEIDFFDLKELTGHQMNGSDCGWWAVYYALMAVYTGGVEFLNPLKGKKLSALPLRFIMKLADVQQTLQLGSVNEALQEEIMTQQGSVNDLERYSSPFAEELMGIDDRFSLQNNSLFSIGKRLYGWSEDFKVIFGVDGCDSTLLTNLNVFVEEENNDKMLVHLINKDGNNWVTLVATHDRMSNKIDFFYADSFGETLNNCSISRRDQELVESANSKSSDGSANRNGQTSDGNSDFGAMSFQRLSAPIYEKKKSLREFLSESLTGKRHSIEDVSISQQSDSYDCGIFAIENARVILSELDQGVLDVLKLKDALREAKHDAKSLEQIYKDILQSEDERVIHESFFDKLSEMLKGFEGKDHHSQQDIQRKLSQMLPVQLQRKFYGFDYVVSMLLGQFLLESQMGTSKPEKYLLLLSVGESVAFLLITSTGGGDAILLNIAKEKRYSIPNTRNFPFPDRSLKVVCMDYLHGSEFFSFSLFLNTRDNLDISEDFKFIPIESLNRKALTTGKNEELFNHLKILFDQVDRVSKLDLDNNRTRFSFSKAPRKNYEALVKGLLISGKEMQSTIMQEEDCNPTRKRLRFSDGSTEKPSEKKFVQDDKVEPSKGNNKKSSSFSSTTIDDLEVEKLTDSSRERCGRR